MYIARKNRADGWNGDGGCRGCMTWRIIGYTVVSQGQAPVPALVEHTGMADEQDGHGDPPLPNSE